MLPPLKDGNTAAIESNTVFCLYGCHLLLTPLSVAARPIRCSVAVYPAAWLIRGKSVEIPDLTARRIDRARNALRAAAMRGPQFLVFADQDLRNAREPRGAPPLDFKLFLGQLGLLTFRLGQQ